MWRVTLIVRQWIIDETKHKFIATKTNQDFPPKALLLFIRMYKVKKKDEILLSIYIYKSKYIYYFHVWQEKSNPSTGCNKTQVAVNLKKWILIKKITQIDYSKVEIVYALLDLGMRL